MRKLRGFYSQDAKKLAPKLLNKMLVRRFDDGHLLKLPITEVEIYYGEQDLACHASKGRTERTEVMYQIGGHVYVYFIYGIHWLLNIVTGPKNHPQAVLIRGLGGASGPGRVGKLLKLDKSFYGEDLTKSKRLWLEGNSTRNKLKIRKLKRVGVAYAGRWANKLWRFCVTE